MMKVVVTYKTSDKEKEFIKNTLNNEATVYFIDEYSDKEATNLIQQADVLLSWNPSREGINKNKLSLNHVKFMQLLSAGYDHVQLEDFPTALKIAANQGAYAEPMAEHVVAMLLALNKRLPIYHKQMAEGHFDQLKSLTRFLKGSVVGIIGFGSIGKATARLLKPFGVRLMAINTSGKTDQEVEFIGTLADLDYVLQNADNLILTIALNKETMGLLNKQRLELMKDDAVLVNVARGGLIDEQALYNHLSTHPDFYAGIDAWWVEPFKDNRFELHYPFFELPNLLGSPHNSAMVAEALHLGTQHALENVLRFIRRSEVKGIIN